MSHRALRQFACNQWTLHPVHLGTDNCFSHLWRRYTGPSTSGATVGHSVARYLTKSHRPSQALAKSPNRVYTRDRTRRISAVRAFWRLPRTQLQRPPLEPCEHRCVATAAASGSGLKFRRIMEWYPCRETLCRMSVYLFGLIS